jgi:hypothetical protein
LCVGVDFADELTCGRALALTVGIVSAGAAAAFAAVVVAPAVVALAVVGPALEACPVAVTGGATTETVAPGCTTKT